MPRHRILLIVFLTWALVMIVPDLLRVAQPLGSYGFFANNDGLIYDVVGAFDEKAQSPAWRAGIREGDRLDLSRLECFPYDKTACGNALAVLGGRQLVLPERPVTLDLLPTSDRPARQKLPWWRKRSRRIPSNASWWRSIRSPGSSSWSQPRGSCGRAPAP